MMQQDSTTTSPFFSVIIPAYNVAGYIEETLESVFSQTWQDFEIIVVDDGSKDETPNILNKIASEQPRLRVVRQPNGGVSRARNTGIREARGKYLAFLDGDDLWLPFHLEHAASFFRQHPDQAWYASGYLTTKTPYSEIEQLKQHNLPDFGFVNYFSGKSGIHSSSSSIYNKNCLKNRDLYPEDIHYGEDFIAYTRFAADFPISGCNRTKTAIYRIREGSAMQLPTNINVRVAQDAILFSELQKITCQGKYKRDKDRYCRNLSLGFWIDRMVCSNTKKWLPYIQQRKQITGSLISLWIYLFVISHCLIIVIFSAPLLLLARFRKKITHK